MWLVVVAQRHASRSEKHTATGQVKYSAVQHMAFIS